MTKKKIVTIALAAVIAVMAIAGASLAYFTDTKTAENTFTMGNVKIKLDETNITDPEGERVTANTYGIEDVYPGATLVKDPIVHNVGKNPAYVRAIVTVGNGMKWLGLYNEDVTAAPTKDAFIALINNTLGENWGIESIKSVTNAESGTTDFVATLKYTEVLEPNTDTTAMFSKIKISEKVTNEDVTNRIGSDGKFNIDVKAEAIQTNGFATWEEAFDAFDGN